MDKQFVPSLIENQLYVFWEDRGYFKSGVDKNKKPFSIILPPPNANGSLHLGHAMFVYEDIMIRYHKMKGYETLWMLGLDHAGFETQFVFEKHLRKMDKSRFDYDRETLFKMIWDFVMENKQHIKDQMRRLGFALDWEREKFTMNPEIVKTVYKTFRDLNDAGLLYRANRMVNYCTYCGTGFSDLEVVHVERKDPLYYLKYGPFILATVRPETKFGDTAVAVNPKDKRYKKWIGQEIEVEGLLGKFRIKVIGDEAIDPKFGTGVAKVTPAHDFNDFEIAKRHNLEFKEVINKEGKLTAIAGPYAGLRVLKARQAVAEDMMKKGLLEKTDNDYTHSVSTCYRCGRVLEPMLMPQWYIKIKPLADKAKELVDKGRIIIHPKRFAKRLDAILDNFIDWNISRQVVWGIRIPAYRCTNSKSQIPNPNSLRQSSSQVRLGSSEARKISNFKFQISNSDRWFVSIEKPDKCQICGECEFEQDTDTFDTWFSSAQWPFATLMSEGKEFYDYFYPTSVMETGHDILRAWVARMIMVGYFATKDIPFQNVYLHGMVRDAKGQKMAKSKGNVIDPIVMVDKYGADALRGALIFGTKSGGDVVLSEQKIIGMRNFANKLWNVGRFIFMNLQIPNSKFQISNKSKIQNSKIIKKLQKEFLGIKKKYTKFMDEYKFSSAFDLLYHFLWHRYADYYIEELKEDLQHGKIEVLDVLKQVFFNILIMLHPFIPFVTEAVWQTFQGNEKSILDERL